jgi:NTE family protein
VLTPTPLPTTAPALTTSLPQPDSEALMRILQVKSIISFYSSAIYGNKKVFVPRWSPEFAFTDPQYFTPYRWTYMYDHSPLVNTAEKYIDYKKLRPKGQPNSRLIITVQCIDCRATNLR